MLPTDAKDRKNIPLCSGLVEYFPDALIAVAEVSQAGSKQHHPNEPIHWDRSKSPDHADCVLRHFWERDSVDTDGQLHLAKAAWRILAMLQLACEDRQAKSPQKPVEERVKNPLYVPPDNQRFVHPSARDCTYWLDCGVVLCKPWPNRAKVQVSASYTKDSFCRAIAEKDLVPAT